MKKTVVRKLLEVVLKVAIFVLLLWAIYKQVFYHRDVNDLFDRFQQRLHNHSLILILLVIFLMPLNWFIEVYKWRMLISKIQKVSFLSATKGILGGITLAIITPSGIGDYAGRLIQLKGRNRLLAIPSAVLSSLAQTLIAITIGLCGGILFAFYNHLFSQNILFTLSLVTLGAGCILFYCYFNPMIFYKILHPFSFFNKIKRYLLTLNRFTKGDLRRFLLFSLLRYSVYSLQYVLVIKAFGIEISMIEGFGAVSILYLIQTISFIPTVLDIGLRGNMALFVFKSYTESDLSILAAVLTIWIVNLMIPALIGYLFIAHKKI